MATSSDVLRVARGEIGYSRWTDPQTGTKYGRWYAQLVHNPYFAENGVPYCAMFATWVFYHANAGDRVPGIPGAYCPTMLAAGRKAGRAVSAYSAQPGDLVYFDWGRDSVADHVGIVEANNGTYLTTIEGNTSVNGSQSNGGRVARRTRAFSVVAGVIRPAWPQPETPYLTKADVRAMQEQIGTPADGEIWGQESAWRARLWGISPDVIKYGAGGSKLVEKMQKRLGVDPDGILGPVTIGAYQTWLGVASDKWWGLDTSRATKAAIRAGRFKAWR